MTKKDVRYEYRFHKTWLDVDPEDSVGLRTDKETKWCANCECDIEPGTKMLRVTQKFRGRRLVWFYCPHCFRVKGGGDAPHHVETIRDITDWHERDQIMENGKIERVWYFGHVRHTLYRFQDLFYLLTEDGNRKKMTQVSVL